MLSKKVRGGATPGVALLVIVIVLAAACGSGGRSANSALQVSPSPGATQSTAEASAPGQKAIALAGAGGGGGTGGDGLNGGRDWPEPGEDAHPSETQFLWDHSQDEICEWGPSLWNIPVPIPGGGTTMARRLSSSDPFTATYQLEDGTILVTNEDLSQGLPDPGNEVEPPTLMWTGPDDFEVEIHQGEMIVYFKDTTTQQQIEQFISDHNLHVILSWFEPPELGGEGNSLAWFHFRYDQGEFPTFDDAYDYFSQNALISLAYPSIKGDWVAPYAETTSPNDTFYGYGWTRYVNLLGVDLNQRIGIGPPNGGEFSNISAAVIDDGVQRWHRDFSWQAHTPGGVRQFSKVSWVGVDCNRSSYWVGVGRGLPARATDTHGTLVSGLMSAITNNNMGVASLSPRSCIVPFRLKFYDDGTHNEESVTKAIRALRFQFGVNLWGDSIRVVNMSLATSRWPYWWAPSQSMKTNINRDLRLNDRLYVAAAGNRGDWPVPSRQYPAAFDNVLGVSGLLTDRYGSEWRASYTLSGGTLHGSNYYPDGYQTYPVSGIYDLINWQTGWIDAVGLSLRGTIDYAHMNGTSGATPQVSALACDLYHLRPWATYTQVRNRIVSTRDDTKARGGIAGLVDYDEALEGW